MSNEDLVALIQAGERDRLPELWDQVEKFVARQARHHITIYGDFGCVTYDDLYNTGYIALVAAADSFDPSAGKSFIGWLALSLKTAFAEAGGYRSKKQAQDPLHFAGSIDAPIGGDEDNGHIGDLIPDPYAAQTLQSAEDSIWNEQLHNVLETALDGLAAAERAVVEGKHYLGYTLRELGPGARTLYNRALVRLRQHKALEEFVELRTPYYHHVGVSSFNTTQTSAVDWIVLERERMEAQWASRRRDAV